MLKYTKEYIEKEYDVEINYLHFLLSFSKIYDMGYSDFEHALVSNGYCEQFAKAISENSFDVITKLKEKNLIIEINLDEEITYMQEGRFEYIHSKILVPQKWKKLMFEYYNKNYIDNKKEERLDL